MNIVTLQQLADVVPGAVVVGAGDFAPGGLNYDSRQVTAGDLFVAIPGERFDGHDFVAGAVASGAAAVVIQVDRAERFADMTIPRIIVPDVRRALAPLSCKFYDYPTRYLYLVGVTGTNGKTTTTRMIDSINRVQFDGLMGTGTIGTLGATIGDRTLPHDRTTPEAPDLQRLFRQMRDAKATFTTMEVASHALALGRTEGCLFNVGVFTNLTQDHLDFHGTMQAYRDAKALLFTEYAKAAKATGKPFQAVINVDDEAGRYYVSLNPSVPVVTYGLSPDYEAEGVHTLHISATDITLKVDEITFTAIVPAIPQNPTGEIPIRLRFGGAFNVYNALAAVAYGVGSGIAAEKIAEGLANCPPVPGRFQPVRTGQEFAVIVDYAHTPDGLENVLKSARPLTSGKLIVVFGCGGNRDRTKRPKMGKIALDLADVAVVTSDNPRREEPEAIIDEILTGMDGVGAEILRESDRRAAIALAVGRAQPGDTVVIAGKGHEDYQILGDQTIHFSDVEVAEEAIRQCCDR